MFDAIHLLQPETKLLHRDIKLDNFRVDDSSHVRMIDLGIIAEYQDKESGKHYQ